jgi:glucose-1-phosphate cytidylyltransferase
MKTVILCGGRGTRLNEMGTAIPKALAPVGDRPVIWHLLKIFASQGFCEFALCLGYLGEEISQYFRELANGGDSELNELEIRSEGLNCRISLFDTGVDTNTGGRLKSIESELAREESFFVTYGDGLADVDLHRLLDFHREHRRTGTLTAVHPVSNFGILDLDSSDKVLQFREKPRLNEWINGGFFVFERAIFEFLQPDSVLEREPLETLANQGELMAYKHAGFWKCMDTYKDNIEMNELWNTHAPWKIW